MLATTTRKLSRLHKPADMSLESWQRELRRQFGREQQFVVANTGTDRVFSDFQVRNERSGSAYRVAIRGAEPGDNYCSCADFVTNALGTCKHIEFVLARLERQRGGRAAFQRGFQPMYSEIVLQYGAKREVRFRPGTACPRPLAALAAKYFDAHRTLRSEAFGTFESFLSEAARFDHDLRCDDDVLSFVAEVRDRARRERSVADAFPRGVLDPGFRTLLGCDLYEYQREGTLFAVRAGRCLIADDMGLGKTIEAMAAAEVMARLFGVERVLIVCPTSLKHQWEREIQRFTTRRATVVGGLRARREQHYAVADSFYTITNYDTVHADLDLIGTWSPDLVILDEAQRIKNWNTRTARSVKRIASPYALVLTGTPLENRLEELVSIVEFVDRHRLGPTFRFLADHQVHDEHGKVVGYRNLDSIGRTLAPMLVRRTKDQVLKQLPERLDKNFFVPMTPQQSRHHEENRDLVARIVAKWRRYKFLSEADQRRLMIALQNMRMSCDSTYLLDHETDFGVKADELSTLLDEVLEQPGSKVVVFSQWTRMHELLVRRIEKKHFGHVFFHGGVEASQRKVLIDRFREDDRCRAFLSTDAGGVGLNLQHASVVVNMDVPWNPAVLEQRIGRVHRLGQRQPVRVVNFVSQGTIEEGMLSVLKFKKSMFAGVLDGGERDVFLGGSRLTRFMESVEKTTAAITESIVEDRDDVGAARPEPEDRDDVGAARPEPEDRDEARVAGQEVATKPTPSAAAGPDGWAALLQTGLTLLEQLAAASRSSPEARREGLRFVHRDPQTGEDYLKIPMPSPDVVANALQSIGTLLDRFRR
ncbi:MAG: DEAD/DEAH box helicase [Acidobacteriota bacterium]